ncbi:lipoate--protein ligase [Lactobacillus sp. LC28-10]|uniref:lipoate--protein ligase n=1 Tax=Secundilactobacillus angelensis TaxID=2722706 RepID=A0ABX1KWU6_9LACO|nr:lipoate--protein ligase [Secundilactobacillus angelensis]MCH5462100.1 lipoate--protein ligase [Secundilactobacillus angelensis]NLR18419.1 lipoate--protein ligase [Secundilactobacillus angelensis]
MIYFPVNSLDVRHNFALEYYLMTEKRPTEPVLLLWSTTPTVMLGKYQTAKNELNRPFIEAHHITAVRRLSGGGTIYNDQGGCQFTLITPTDDATIDFSSGLNLVTQALNQIGINAQDDSRNDLVVDGRKVSGSAQYLTDGYRLHHGSLLFNANLDWMAQALKVDPDKMKAKHIQSVRQRTVNLIDQQPDWDAEKFKKELERTLLNLTHAKIGHLKSVEEDRLRQIAASQFNEKSVWKSEQRPYDHVHKNYLTGIGVVSVAFDLDQQQRLADIKLSGDFFSNINLQHFKKALIGKPYQREMIAPVIEAQLNQSPIKGLQPDQLTDLLF